MTEDLRKEDEEKNHAYRPVENRWGEETEDHFGYASDEERRQKRGLEDWELVDTIPDSQKRVPKWFIGVIVAVAFVAVSLSFPFFGLRTDSIFNWSGWSIGVIAAVVYLIVAGLFVAFMVRLYGSRMGGRLDSDKEKDSTDEGE
jgi:antibiotic biosynthesis monooxygenase (ABM) superfamily enzyme